MSLRVPGLSVSELQQSLADSDALLKRFPELSDPRLHSTFLTRARARWALGQSVEYVLADLRSSALCIEGQASIRLFKLEHHKLRSRRIEPLHLAALHPEPEFVESFGRDYGLPLAAWYADAASNDLDTELKVISGYFNRSQRRTDRIEAPHEMVGLAAATYAAAFGYLAAGDDGSASVVLRMIAQLSNELTTAPPEPARRYLRQCASLAAIHRRDDGELTESLEGLLADVSHDATSPSLVIPALVGLAMLVNVEPDLESFRDQDPYTWSLANAVREAWFQVE